MNSSKQVIGVYGVSGCGKSYALSKAKKHAPEWRCLDGSELIEVVMRKEGLEGGIAAFKKMNRAEKERVRLQATSILGDFQGITLVAGHASFLTESGFDDVFTNGDGAVYDFIVLLETSTQTIVDQRRNDSSRTREDLCTHQIQAWMDHERKVLQGKCQEFDIDLHILANPNDLVDLIRGTVLPRVVTKARRQSEKALQEAVQRIPHAQVYLLIDGDRTLSPTDTGKLMVETVQVQSQNGSEHQTKEYDSAKSIFKRYNDYCFQPFLEVAMYFNIAVQHETYGKMAATIASQTSVHDEWLCFLRNLPSNTQPILVSSGVPEIWKRVVQLHGIDMPVIAGCNVGLHPYIVDSNAKTAVAVMLRDRSARNVIFSFGDSGPCCTCCCFSALSLSCKPW